MVKMENISKKKLIKFDPFVKEPGPISFLPGWGFFIDQSSSIRVLLIFADCLINRRALNQAG